jgi:hypothetical protein
MAFQLLIFSNGLLAIENYFTSLRLVIIVTFGQANKREGVFKERKSSLSRSFQSTLTERDFFFSFTLATSAVIIFDREIYIIIISHGHIQSAIAFSCDTSHELHIESDFRANLWRNTR